MNVQVTPNMIARAAADWSLYAGEKLDVEHISGCLYAFGSELGCRRLADKMGTGRVLFSKNLGRWTYAKELRFVG